MKEVKARLAEIDRRYKSQNKPRRITVGALRAKELQRLFRHRYGYALPDNDLGRDAALIIAHVLAGRRDDPQRLVENYLELQAPWMSRTEIDGLIGIVLPKPRWERAAKLGNRLNLTRAERSHLKIRTIRAAGTTEKMMIDDRKEKDRLYQEHRRRAAGAKPRAEYEANSVTSNKPWRELGISRATYYDRKKKANSNVISFQASPPKVPPPPLQRTA